MKKNGILLAITLSIFLPALFAAEQLVDRVVAVVNQDVITQSELDALFQPIADQYRKVYHNEELVQKLSEARLKLLNQLIEDRLVLIEARKEGVDAPEQEVTERLEEFKKHFESDAAFEETLKSQQMSLAALRTRITEQVIIQKQYFKAVQQRIIVTPLEIETYYRTHPDQFNEKEGVEVWTMTFRKSTEAQQKGIMDQEAKKRAMQAAEELKKGSDFSEVAKKMSEDVHAKDGGRMGLVSKGDLTSQFDDAIFNLPSDSISDILESEEAYHLFKTGSRHTARMLSLEDVRDRIYDVIYRQKVKARFEEWMKELKKNAFISIR